MEYRILNAVDENQLSDKVNNLIKVGFEPLGGVCVSVTQNFKPNAINLKESERLLTTVVFCQAMIKK